MKADRVTIHHEGAGSPTDNVDRPLKARYSIAIGLTLYKLANPPEKSFVTNGQGGVHSLQVVFTGDRRTHPVTDRDVELYRRAIREAHARGWVTGDPEVFLHGDTDSSDCPGAMVRARRADLTAASKSWTVIALTKEKTVRIVAHPAGGYYVVKASGSVHPFGAPFHGDLSKNVLSAPIVSMDVTPSGNGYYLLGEDGGVFAFGDAVFIGRV
jgi:hypothetical protein